MEKLILKDVSKKIGKSAVLSHISLELKSDAVYGFVGRNGSGKTMLFRAISGLMKISSGEIRIDNLVLHKDISIAPNLGLVLENAGLYPEFTGMQNLKFLSKINKKIGEDEIREAIKRVGLDPDDKRTIKKYSLGMKQRIVLAQAIMEKPEILLLDEPTNALDESGVKLLRNIVCEEKQRGALILIASHSREDIELLCDKVFRMENGVIIGGE